MDLEGEEWRVQPSVVLCAPEAPWTADEGNNDSKIIGFYGGDRWT